MDIECTDVEIGDGLKELIAELQCMSEPKYIVRVNKMCWDCDSDETCVNCSLRIANGQ